MYSRTHLCLLRSPRAADTEITFSSKKLRDGSCWSGTARMGPKSGPGDPANWRFMPGVPSLLP